MSTVDPFEVLTDYDKRIRAVARKLPREVVTAQWTGVECQVAGQRFVSRLDNIVEIIAKAVMTPVPLSKPWLLGVTNLRGHLLPITDVGYWLTGTPVTGQRPRILVVRESGILFGLQLPEVFGLLRLSKAQVNKQVTITGPMSPYAVGELQTDDKTWPIVDFGRILADTRFYQTAVSGSTA